MQERLVQSKYPRDRGAALVNVLSASAKGFRIFASILGGADRRLHRTRRQLLLVQSEIPKTVSGETHGVVLIVDRERSRVAGFHRFDLAAHDADAQTMKGRDQRRTANFQSRAECGDAIAQLSR